MKILCDYNGTWDRQEVRDFCEGHSVTLISNQDDTDVTAEDIENDPLVVGKVDNVVCIKDLKFRKPYYPFLHNNFSLMIGDSVNDAEQAMKMRIPYFDVKLFNADRICLIARSGVGKSFAASYLKSKFDFKSVNVAEPIYAEANKIKPQDAENQDGNLLREIAEGFYKRGLNSLLDPFKTKLQQLEGSKVINEDVRVSMLPHLLELGFVPIVLDGPVRKKRHRSNDEWESYPTQYSRLLCTLGLSEYHELLNLVGRVVCG